MTKKDDFTDFDYAAKTAELEAVLLDLQDTEVQLDEALKLHARGKALVAELEQYLEHAEIVVKHRVTDEAA